MPSDAESPPAVLPFMMLHRDPVESPERGYTPYPSSWSYDPVAQTTDLLPLGGKTEPTTVSEVAGTTGFMNRDSDQANDDKGTD